MALADELFGQIRYDSFRPSIGFGGHAFTKRRHLRNSHGVDPSSFRDLRRSDEGSSLEAIPTTTSNFESANPMPANVLMSLVAPHGSRSPWSFRDFGIDLA